MWSCGLLTCNHKVHRLFAIRRAILCPLVTKLFVLRLFAIRRTILSCYVVRRRPLADRDNSSFPPAVCHQARHPQVLCGQVRHPLVGNDRLTLWHVPCHRVNLSCGIIFAKCHLRDTVTAVLCDGQLVMYRNGFVIYRPQSSTENWYATGINRISCGVDHAMKCYYNCVLMGYILWSVGSISSVRNIGVGDQL